MSQDVEDLMTIASEAGLPEKIMSFLIMNDIVACINYHQCHTTLTAGCVKVLI